MNESDRDMAAGEVAMATAPGETAVAEKRGATSHGLRTEDNTGDLCLAPGFGDFAPPT